MVTKNFQFITSLVPFVMSLFSLTCIIIGASVPILYSLTLLGLLAVNQTVSAKATLNYNPLGATWKEQLQNEIKTLTTPTIYSRRKLIKEVRRFHKTGTTRFKMVNGAAVEKLMKLDPEKIGQLLGGSPHEALVKLLAYPALHWGDKVILESFLPDENGIVDPFNQRIVDYLSEKIAAGEISWAGFSNGWPQEVRKMSLKKKDTPFERVMFFIYVKQAAASALAKGIMNPEVKLRALFLSTGLITHDMKTLSRKTFKTLHRLNEEEKEIFMTLLSDRLNEGKLDNKTFKQVIEETKALT